MSDQGIEAGRRQVSARARRQAHGPDAESFRLLVDAVEDCAIFMLDADGLVASWNAGAQRIKGYEADEILGKHFSIFYTPEDLTEGTPDRELEAARRDGPVEDEGWRVRKDGSRFWASVVITPVFDDDGAVRGFAKITRDLTERRKAEDARSRFIANAAHELRTPLAVLVGLISFLKQADELTPEEFTEQVDVLARQAERMHNLVNNLLDLTLLEEGQGQLPEEPVDVAAVVEHVLFSVPPPTDKRVSVDCDGAIVLAEERRLEQILTNLLSNAYRYGGDAIIVRARTQDGFVDIEVTDNGPGVEPGLQPHLFEPFRRGPKTGSIQGSGLGLAIVKGLVEAFDGKITLDRHASGARFIVTLKRAS